MSSTIDFAAGAIATSAAMQAHRGDRTRAAIILVCALLLMSMGIVVGYGWLTHQRVLIELHTGWPSMKFNTALCFIAFGLGALTLLQGRRHIAMVCAALVLTIGAATAVETALDVSLGLDDLFIRPFATEPLVPAGRMSPVTAWLFAAAGASLLSLAVRASPRVVMIAGLCAAVIAGIATAVVIGYLTRTPTAYGWGLVASVAAHTGISFLLVAAALGALATGSPAEHLPRWVPWAGFIAGMACTVALGIALFEQLPAGSTSLMPEIALAIGTTLSLLSAFSLNARRQIGRQRDLLTAALREREAALAERARLAAIVESSTESIIGVDLNNRVVVCNPAAERMFGYAAGEMLGRPLEAIVPEDRLAEVAVIGAKARSGISTSRLRTVRLRGDGHRLDVEIDVSPIRDATGAIVGVAGIARDISLQIEAEQMLSGVLEAAPDAMVITDAAGTIVLVNSMTETMFGYRREELLGQPVECLVPQHHRAGHGALRNQFLSGALRRVMGAGRDLRAARRDGTEFSIDVALNILELPNRTLAVAAVRDATARRQIEQHLRDAVANKDLLLKEIHHRVKNNLQVVASMLALQAQQVPEPDVQLLFERCRQRVMSIAMVHEKLYGGDLDRVDIGALVREITTMLLGQDVEPAIQVYFHIESIAVDIEIAFPASLIVNELVTNALKHAFAGRTHGRLSVTVARRAVDRIRIDIADDGPGTLTLEAFNRGGTLGATIVRSLVRQLDGELSIGPPPGSSIAVEFPDRRGVA